MLRSKRFVQCPQSTRDCYKLTALKLDLNLSKLFSSLISLAKSLKIKAPCIAKRFLPDSVLDLGSFNSD